MLENYQRNGQHLSVRGVLDDDAVLQINPGGGQVSADIAREDLNASAILLRLPVGRGDEYRMGAVLKTEINTRLEPFGWIRDSGASQEPIDVAEVIVPLDMIGSESFQIRTRRLALGERPCADT